MAFFPGVSWNSPSFSKLCGRSCLCRATGLHYLLLPSFLELGGWEGGGWRWQIFVVWSYLPAGRLWWDVLVLFCVHGCAGCCGSMRVAGLAQGSSSTWPPTSLVSFPLSPPLSPSSLPSCLLLCSFDSLLLKTLLRIS